ncbi:hypothetical protein N7492_005900 [Penicillium capsulatum]|uniref:Uncharacterized protein n=1 Tax=Penicillium capsulatum TaxID=69766 RepID=A0A9W9LRK6_9EURO|nr:hypothetical protein N7492_005900 [Penicillium capsulatum]KAJ6134998.1 hypothetical protein N7512_000158 [Penicillium capsulatum]
MALLRPYQKKLSLFPLFLLLASLLFNSFGLAIPVRTSTDLDDPDPIFSYLEYTPWNESFDAHGANAHSSIRTRDVNILVPGVDEIKEKIKEFGIVQSKPNLFYTRQPVEAINKGKVEEWGKAKYDEEPKAGKKDWKFAMWGRLADTNWVAHTSIDLAEEMEEAEFTDEQSKPFRDMFLQNIGQAYGEMAHGDVIILVKDEVTPDNRSWDVNRVLGGWEFPALTRNSDVKRIYRVDPDECGEPRLIWSHGDAESDQKPKGRREGTRPTKS